MGISASRLSPQPNTRERQARTLHWRREARVERTLPMGQESASCRYRGAAERDGQRPPRGARELFVLVIAVPFNTTVSVSSPRSARAFRTYGQERPGETRRGSRATCGSPDDRRPGVPLAVTGLEEVFDQKIAHVCDLLSGYRVIVESATL